MSFTRFATPRCVVVAVFVGALVALPGSATAQIGGLIRKAKDAATQPKEESAANGTVKPSTAFGTELDDATFGSLMKGLEAVTAKADQRDELRTQQEKVQKQFSDLLDKRKSDQEKLDNAMGKVTACQSAFLQKRQQEHQAKFKQEGAAKAMDPAFQQGVMQDQMKYSQDVQEAMKKGDTAAVRRLGQEQADKMASRMGIDLHADTAAAVTLCGAKPATPSWKVEEEGLRAQVTRLGEQIRDVERDMELAGVQASGMQAQKFAMARERVLNWYRGDATGSKAIQQFGASERKTFEANRARIEKVAKAL